MKKKLHILFSVLIAFVSVYAQQSNTGNMQVHQGIGMTFFGDFTNTNSGTLTIDGVLYVKQKYTDNGTTTHTPNIKTGIATFNGTAKQTVTGTGNTTFPTMRAKNTKNFNILKDVNIAYKAEFVDGILYVNDTHAIIFQKGAKPLYTKDKSHVDGWVRKVGNEQFVFPIGDKGYYRQAAISAPTSKTDVFSARYYFTDPNTHIGSAKKYPVKQVNNKEYWKIERTNGTATPQVTLKWNLAKTSGSIPTEISDVVIINWNNNTWKNQGATNHTGSQAKGTVTANVTNYGYFTFGVLVGTRYWIGTVNTDWGNTNNWRSKTIPSPGDNVEFATAANNGGTAAVNDLHVPGTAGNPTVIDNLTNGSGKALVVPAEKAIVINGTVTGSSTLANAHKIHVKAEANKPNGSLLLAGQCGKGAVYGTVEMMPKSKKLASPVTWTDNIDGSPTEGAVYSTDYEWQYFGVPVKQVVANPNFAGSYIRQYFETKNGTKSYYEKWSDLNNKSVLKAFGGYEITHDELPAHPYMLQGELLTCDKNLTLTRKAPPVGGTALRPGEKYADHYYGLGQNVFANSYTSAINVEKIQFPPQVEKTVYLYNTATFSTWGNINGNVATDETSFVAGQYLAIPQGVATTIYDGRIPSMNGFMLRFTPAETLNKYNSPNATVKLVVNGNGVLPNTKPQTAPKNPLKFLELTLKGKYTQDKLWMFEKEEATEAYDNGWDGRKFFGRPAAYIYTQAEGYKLQVNTAPTLNNKLINIKTNKETDYTLTISRNNLNTNEELYLVDLINKELIPLNQEQTKYQFNAKANTTSRRFKIVKGTINQDNIFDSKGITIKHFAHTILATNYTNQTGKLKVLDLSGRQVVSKDLYIGENKYQLTLAKGTYIILAEAKGVKKTNKIIIY